MGFDNQLGAVERTLQAKIKDYEELLLLSGDANHAREVCPSRKGYAVVQKRGKELWASRPGKRRKQTERCRGGTIYTFML